MKERKRQGGREKERGKATKSALIAPVILALRILLCVTWKFQLGEWFHRNTTLSQQEVQEPAVPTVTN